MDKLMKQALEQNKIVRYIPTFIKVMETYKKLLEEHNEAFRQCNVSGRSEQLPNTCECDNVETYNGWGNEPCVRCLDCGRVW